MTAWYNEIDPKAALWLRELIKQGHIADGVVDERSIEDVVPSELAGFIQCHFFAGIGGWSYALRLAGWPDDRPVWTGSCPCQPFSSAGQLRGTADERHLWPAFGWLINQCRPAVVFGEQVASRAGRGWLAGVRADLEALGYGVGAADLCAAGVGAPHIRQRLYWVADNDRGRCGLERSGRLLHGERSALWHDTDGRSADGGLGDADDEGPQGRCNGPDQCARKRSAWASSLDNWLPCADGKSRRIEPGLEPLAHGLPARVVRLRGYGNAIVPQVAAQFVSAFVGSRSVRG